MEEDQREAHWHAVVEAGDSEDRMRRLYRGPIPHQAAVLHHR